VRNELRRTTVEKYAGSVNTSCLTSDETHHQTDILAAVALSSKLGSLLCRVKYAGDQFSLVPMLEAWRAIVSKKAKNRGWANVSDEVADISLWFWIDDVCQTCHGRKYQVIPGTPTLSAEQCPTCQATGKNKLQCDQEIKEYVLDAIQSLETLAIDAGRLANKKLR
jgi:hypothetical protein